ncbi:MAG TPA: PQQ-binding-like beta-propeller repeat protein [Vicinamibacteria bacterium]|nr:PQQ-binding-like beta-propeller repeat protein [Vicinamibacteria bacterium]
MPEDDAFVLGRDVARELVRAHAETPPRFPSVDPAAIPMVEGKPRLDSGSPSGREREALFELGALLHQVTTATPPHVSWLLDGPPPAPLSSLTRRAVLASLTATTPDARFASAAQAAEALENEVGAPPADTPSWPLFRGSASRVGASAEATAFAGLTASWSVDVGNVVASPTLSPRLVLVVTTDGRLVALDRPTGRLLLTLRISSACESSPALSEGRVFVGSDEGDLLGFDLGSGAEAFRVKLGKLVRASPLPLGERVVVGVVDAKEAGAVVALDRATGKVLWRRKRGAVFSSPAAEGGRLLVGGDDGALEALDPENGSVVWTHEVGGRVRATPALAAGLAIVGDFDGRLVGVRLQDGGRAWTREFGQPIYSSACVFGDLVVVGCHDGVIHGVRASTGDPVFDTPTRGPVVASPVAGGDRTVVGSTDGDLYVLDGSGRVLARSRLAEGGTQASGALDAQGLVVGSTRGVHAFALAR